MIIESRRQVGPFLVLGDVNGRFYIVDSPGGGLYAKSFRSLNGAVRRAKKLAKGYPTPWR